MRIDLEDGATVFTWIFVFVISKRQACQRLPPCAEANISFGQSLVPWDIRRAEVGCPVKERKNESAGCRRWPRSSAMCCWPWEAR